MDYEEFSAQIKKICNIDLSNYKEKQMKRRIDSLKKRNGHDNYESYLKQLIHSKEHLREFLNYITINVSEFFRNPAQWEVLEKEIIPELISGKSTLKIWSSACSTGEEPYSLPSKCDLILCRNVMIYFTEEAKEKLYKKFYDALSDDGIFFVGSTEQIIMPQKYGFTSRRHFFYQKIIAGKTNN